MSAFDRVLVACGILALTPHAQAQPGTRFPAPLAASPALRALPTAVTSGPALTPPGAGPDASPEGIMDDGWDLIQVRVPRGTTVSGAVVELCPGEGAVTAVVRIAGALTMALAGTPLF